VDFNLSFFRARQRLTTKIGRHREAKRLKKPAKCRN